MNIKILLLTITLLILSACSSTNINTNPTTNDGSSINTNNRDYLGNDAKNTLYSERLIGQRLSDISVQFQYNIASNDVIIQTSAGATITQNNSMAILQTGTNPNAHLHLESVEAVRYRPGHEAYMLYTVAFITGGVANVIQLTGVHNENEDGFVIGYNGTKLVTGRIVGGKSLFNERSNWKDKLDGTGVSGCNVDFSQFHQYRINYAWLGIAPINFEVYCGIDKGWVNFDNIDLTNLQQRPTINNPVLPMNIHIEKNNVAQNIEIRTGSWNGGIINSGFETTGIRPFFTANRKNIPSGTLTNILTVKINQTHFGKTNRINSILQYISAVTSGAQLVDLYLIKNANLGGTPNFIEIDHNNSVTLVDKSGTTVSGGTTLHIFPMATIGQMNIDLIPFLIDIHKNETLTIAATSTATSTVGSSLRWEESY